jgi:hypothetical protein
MVFHFSLLFIYLFIISSCTINDKYEQSTFKQEHTLSLSQCDNIFVISGLFDKIKIFQHESNNTNFKLIKEFEVPGATQGFYDCLTEKVVVLQKKTTKAKGGIRIFNLKNNTNKLHLIPDGQNVIIARYKEGFIYSSALVRNAKVNKKKYGCIPSEDIFPYNIGIDNSNFKMASDYKNNKVWYNFEYTHYYNLTKNKIEKSYPFGLIENGYILNDTLFAHTNTSLLQIDLRENYAYNFFSACKKKENYGKELIMNSVPRLFIKDKYYTIYRGSKRQKINKQENFKMNFLYEVSKNNVIPKLKIASNNIKTMISNDNKNILIFTKDRQILKYNIVKNKIVNTYNIDVDIPDEYTLYTVGYTKSNFIISFEKEYTTESYIIVANNKLNQFSKPYKLNIAQIDITSSLTLSTNSLKVVR